MSLQNFIDTVTKLYMNHKVAKHFKNIIPQTYLHVRQNSTCMLCVDLFCILNHEEQSVYNLHSSKTSICITLPLNSTVSSSDLCSLKAVCQLSSKSIRVCTMFREKFIQKSENKIVFTFQIQLSSLILCILSGCFPYTGF